MSSDNLIKYIGSSEYWYAPVGIFALILIIAGLFGAWTGWKSALYFLGWNVVALITAVLFLDMIIDKIDKSITINGITDKINFKYVMQKYGASLILFFVLLGSNILAGIVYWIPGVRKFLKKTIKENKKNNRSNAGTRLIGVGVGTISALPMAVFFAESTSIISNSNRFTDFNGYLFKALTGNKVKGISRDDKDELKEIIKATDNPVIFDEIIKVINGDISSITPSDKEQVQNLLNNKALHKSIKPSFIKSKLGGKSMKSVIEDAINNIPKISPGEKIHLDESNVSDLKKLISEIDSGTNSPSDKQIDEFIDGYFTI